MSRRSDREPGAMIYGAVPRARLMPPEVAQRREDAGRRRALVSLTLLVVLLTVVGVVGSYWFAAQAQARLSAERGVTDELLATQLEYSEVVTVKNELTSITEIRSSLSAVELLWLPTLAEYLAVLQPGETVDALTIIGDAPAEPPLTLAGPLRSPKVATVTLVISTATMPAPQNWIRAWRSIESYADASIDSVTFLSDAFETTITLNINESALAQRFGPEEETE